VPALVDVVQQIRWQDVVDVLFLTFVLFRLTVWLRGTVALQVLAGMLLLAAGAFAAIQFGLFLTAYLLQALGAIATLVVVVIFRDEIRRALHQVNPFRLWRERVGRGGPRPTATIAEVLADSAFALARRRIGAILVVPDHDPLDEHLTGGVEVDARPSIEVLEALFVPASPLHDGATIIEAGRVARAGCFLPLSTSPSLPDTYGSRHRAAAGLSERCDAAVVVVSEERGQVTLFCRAEADQMTSGSALAARLSSGRAVRRTGRGARGARARLVDVLTLIGIFLLVVGAWYAVVGEPGSVVTHTVSVELRNVPQNLEADPPSPGRVAVHLRGPRTRLDGLGSGDVQAYIDLSDARPGARRRELVASAPAGVEITEIVPSTVLVRIRPRRR
jgi:diadenylate cyclase